MGEQRRQWLRVRKGTRNPRAAEETMHVLGGLRGSGGTSNVSRTLCIFHIGLCKYTERSCLLSLALVSAPSYLPQPQILFPHEGEGKKMVSKSSTNCDQTHTSISFWIFGAITGFLKCSLSAWGSFCIGSRISLMTGSLIICCTSGLSCQLYWAIIQRW